MWGFPLETSAFLKEFHEHFSRTSCGKYCRSFQAIPPGVPRKFLRNSYRKSITISQEFIKMFSKEILPVEPREIFQETPRNCSKNSPEMHPSVPREFQKILENSSGISAEVHQEFSKELVGDSSASL